MASTDSSPGNIGVFTQRSMLVILEAGGQHSRYGRGICRYFLVVNVNKHQNTCAALYQRATSLQQITVSVAMLYWRYAMGFREDLRCYLDDIMFRPHMETDGVRQLLYSSRSN